MTTPIVSIIIPCYNHGVFLKECLDSVLDQTYNEWECIIIDNGSEDNTKEVTEKFVEKDKRFNYLYTDNHGVSAARNTGILKSTGKYILPLDADDKIRNIYLENAVPILEMTPTVKIVYCQAERFGIKKGKWKLPEFNMNDILMENSIFCTSLFRKADFENTKGFNENMRTGFEDWDFWLSLLETGGDVYKIQETCFYYRIRKQSRNNRLNLEMQKELRLQIFYNHQELYERNNLSTKNINSWYLNKKKIETLKKTTFYKIIRFFPSPLKRILSNMISK